MNGSDRGNVVLTITLLVGYPSLACTWWHLVGQALDDPCNHPALSDCCTVAEA